MNNIIKYFISIAAGFLLIYAGFNYLLSDEQRKLLFLVPAYVHIISIILAISIHILSGFELRLLYYRISKITISFYDTLTLPIVTNLWGFIIPFQGSFVYTVSYIYFKYKKKISDSLRVYLIAFSISMFFAGFIGILYSITKETTVPDLFTLICVILFINPLLILLIARFSKTINLNRPVFVKQILEKTKEIIKPDQLDFKLVVYLLLINIITVALTTLWFYWIALNLEINFTIMQLILISLLMKLTTLFKLTPGNLGLNQFATGGVAVLVGGTINDGFLLSTFQYLTIIIIAISLGSLFSFVNMKYFNWKTLKSMLSKKKVDKSRPII